jgi:eukaryotic-like serine/threonine-protein kinase
MDAEPSVKTTPGDLPRRCPACGTPYPEGDDGLGCPVCLLQGVLEAGPRGERDLPENQPLLLEGGHFDHYALVRHADGAFEELGRGAMGVTYKALDTILGHAVALKVIDARLAADPNVRQRFLREARAAARLRHPNAASVFYYGVRESDGQCFYAMELVEGETLEARLRRAGPLPTSLALEVIAQVAKALIVAEAHGLVHRDLKPANLMLVEGPELTVKVIDFGLAKAVSTDGNETDLTQAGFVGTPAFASPEQFAGAGVDIRSDLYSLGVTLWVILTGKAPFRESWPEVMHQQLHAPLPLEQLKGLPRAAVALLQTLLEKDPTRRFQTPTDLLNAMQMVTNELEAPPTNKKQRLLVPFVHELSSKQAGLLRAKLRKRSIAVLPFDSLSDKKKDSYFADGVHDEILSNLAKVSQLKVISRTSVMAYRSHGTRDLRWIAKALRVANVVEGTVRRDGNRVRITTRLVDARTDQTLWSDSYDRELRDIFAIQSEIAQTVASKLSARLAPGEQKAIEEEPTDDLEAYDLYLQAKAAMENSAIYYIGSRANLLNAIKFLAGAIRRDPRFAMAHCLAAKAHDCLYAFDVDKTQERRVLGDAAISEALRLRPDLPEVHLAAAYHRYACYLDFESARAQIAIAQRARPNNPEAMALAGRLDQRQGHWEASTMALENAVTLDPKNPELLQYLSSNYMCLRRYRNYEQICNRLIELRPDKPFLMVQKAYILCAETADVAGFRAVLAELPSSVKDDMIIASVRFRFAVLARDWTDANEILTKSENANLSFSYAQVNVPRECLKIWLAEVRGDYLAFDSECIVARDRLARVVALRPGDGRLLSALSVIDAASGRKEQAIQEATHAVELQPISQDAVQGPPLVNNLAVVYARTGEPDLAFQELFMSVKTPGGVNYGELKLDPAWDPLRNDSRFDELLVRLAPHR